MTTKSLMPTQITNDNKVTDANTDHKWQQSKRCQHRSQMTTKSLMPTQITNDNKVTDANRSQMTTKWIMSKQITYDNSIMSPKITNNNKAINVNTEYKWSEWYQYRWNKSNKPFATGLILENVLVFSWTQRLGTFCMGFISCILIKRKLSESFPYVSRENLYINLPLIIFHVLIAKQPTVAMLLSHISCICLNHW